LKKEINRRIRLRKLTKRVKNVYQKMKPGKQLRDEIHRRIQAKKNQTKFMNKSQRLANYVRRFNSIPSANIRRIIPVENRNSFLKFYNTLYDLNSIIKRGNKRNLNSILQSNFSNRNLSANDKKVLMLAYRRLF